MKKSLLLLGAALLMTASAMAQTYSNPREKAGAPATVSAATYNYAAEEGGDTLYLWNVKYGGFYSNVHKGGGWPYYGTRAAAVDTIGAKVVFTRQNPQNAEAEQGAEWVDAEGNTDIYLLVSYVDWEGKNAFMCTFADGWNNVWTDWNNQTNRYWHVKLNGQYLNLSVADVNETAVGWDKYNLCVRPLEKDADKLTYLNIPEIKEWQIDPETGEEVEVVTQEGIPAGEEVGEDWAIVAPETYATYIVESKEKNTLYALGNQLAADLNYAVEACGSEVVPYLDTQIQILNDVTATADMLQGAIDAIPDIIKNFNENRATPDNPVDYTAGLTNPSFENGKTGWNGPSSGFNIGGQCAEIFNVTPFDVNQVVTNLPAGVYRVSNQAFYRAGGHGAGPEYERYAADPTADRNAMLYGRSKDYGEVSVKIKRAIDEAQPDALYPSNDSKLPSTAGLPIDGYFIPNSMDGARAWFDANHYQNELFLGVSGRDDELTIGFKKSVGIGNDWCIFDNFQLWYYGSTLEAYKLWASEVKKTLGSYDWDNIYYGAPDKQAFDAVAADLESAATIDAITTAIASVEDVTAAVDKSIEQYNLFVAEVTGFDAWLDENGVGESTYREKLEIYMDKTEVEGPSDDYPNGTAAYILDYYNGAHAGTLSAEEMEAELAFIEQMKADAMEHGLTKGTNLSYLIKNPKFEGINGDQVPNWTAEGGLTATNVPQAEFFNKNFDFYQDIYSDVIMTGIYDVSVQAFYRTTSNDAAWAAYQADPTMTGEAKVHTYVYLNEFATPVKNVMEIAYDSNLANNCYSRSDGKYTLDGMASAAVAFAYADESKNFTQHTYGLVTEEEAGHIRLGIRNTTGTLGSRWTLFGNFGFRYMGKDAEALKSVIGNYLDRDATLDMLAVLDGDYEDWANAMDATEGYEDIEGDDQGDSEELFKMLIDLVGKYNTVSNSPEVVAELTTALEALDNYIADHDGELDPSVVGSIQDWEDARYEDIGEGDVAPHGTTEEYKGYIQLAEEYLEQLKESLIDFDTLPADLTSFITNPDYADGNGGWSTQPAEGYGAVEHYNMTFDHNQTIKLPKDGYYLLTLRAFDRIGGATNDYSIYTAGTYGANAQAAIYAKTGDAIYEHHICQPSKHAVTAAGEADWAPTQTSPGPWAQGADGVDIYLPNNMNIASLMFSWYRTDPSNLGVNPMTGEDEILDQTAGYFYNQLFFYGLKGEATIGLNKTANVGGSWCIWDDWKLWYLGEEVPVGINDVQNDNLVAAPVQRSIYNLGGAKVQQLQRGFNIIRTVDAEGNVKVQKIFVK